MSLPYFPMYPTDFEADTSHLSMAEDGAYNRLLRICWMTPGCTMPTDEAWIMRRVRAQSDEDREAVKIVLSEFFTVVKGRYSNARLAKEFASAIEAHEKRKKAGSRGGLAKALKTNKSTSSNAKAMLKQPEPEPEPYKERDTNVSHVIPHPEPASPIAEAVKVYNDTAGQVGWPKVQKLTPARSKALKARLTDCGGIEGWRMAMDKGKASDFLCGRSANQWTGCGFDWIVKQANFTKLMEGNYDNRDHNPSRQNGYDAGTDRPGSGMAAAFATIAERRSRSAGEGGGGCDGSF